MSAARLIAGSILMTFLGVTGCLAPFQGRTSLPAPGDEPPLPAVSSSDEVPRADVTGSWSVGLAEVLALAGAKNIDIEIVLQRVEEASAGVDAARSLYLPDLRIGIGYKRHDGRLQETRGAIFDVSRQSALVGPELSLSVDLARAHFERLRALQLADAAGHLAARTRAETVVHAAVLYLQLVRATGLVGVANDAIDRSRAHVELQSAAVEARAALQVQLERAKAQLARDAHRLLAAQEEAKRARMKLAVWLRLPPTTDLRISAEDVVPVTLVPQGEDVSGLVDRALATRPDLSELRALENAAQESLAGAEWRPWIPEAHLYAGYGLHGGGRHGGFGSFGDRVDLGLGVSWTLEGLALSDRAARRAAAARSIGAALEREKLEDRVRAEVLDSWERAKSLRSRIEAARQHVEATRTTQSLVQARFDANDAIQLEVLEAVREHSDARAVLVDAIVDYNQNQHILFYRVHGGAWTKSR